MTRYDTVCIRPEEHKKKSLIWTLCSYILLKAPRIINTVTTLSEKLTTWLQDMKHSLSAASMHNISHKHILHTEQMALDAKAKDQTFVLQGLGVSCLRCIREQQGGIVGKVIAFHQEDHLATTSLLLKCLSARHQIPAAGALQLLDQKFLMLGYSPLSGHWADKACRWR